MKQIIYKYIKLLLIYLNIYEQLNIFIFKKNKKILNLNDMKLKFNNLAIFAFATGGSLSNLNKLEILGNKNILCMNTGIVHFYRLYNVMPNIWFVHNPDSVKMTIREIKKYNLQDKIDFSNTFILVPSNSSNSKWCSFSSKVFKEFRKLINDKATFVFYYENKNAYPPEQCPKNYLQSIEPIEFINGSAVENTFLPWLSYIGVKTIFFSGVDHMDTGHFWDRKEYYQDINGRALNFQPNELIFECGRVARAKCKEKGISVYRLEKTETILQDYEYIEFDKAYEMASEKKLPKDLK
jgi:hypothetical protein